MQVVKDKRRTTTPCIEMMGAERLTLFGGRHPHTIDCKAAILPDSMDVKCAQMVRDAGNRTKSTSLTHRSLGHCDAASPIGVVAAR
jgi:hypothetical protein